MHAKVQRSIHIRGISKGRKECEAGFLCYNKNTNVHLHSTGSIATIALVAALSVSAASIATEVYFAINKCCGVQPQVCRDSDEFNSIKETLEPLSQAIDQKALESKNSFLHFLTENTSFFYNG